MTPARGPAAPFQGGPRPQNRLRQVGTFGIIRGTDGLNPVLRPRNRVAGSRRLLCEKERQMKQMKEMNRRGLLGGLCAGTVASLGLFNAGCSEGSKIVAPPKPKALPTWKNEDFYDAEGKLDAAKAKAAYYALMEFHGFPILPSLRTDEFWVLDFALGKFTEVGMGGTFYVNHERDNYLLHDIWLLPGQMIPEHYHIKLDTVGPKMESWLVRHGTVSFYAEGEATPGVDERIPPLHRTIAKARAEVVHEPGGVVKQEVPEARHWMLAGSTGAIVTEVATYHSMDALKFTHPDIKL